MNQISCFWSGFANRLWKLLPGALFGLFPLLGFNQSKPVSIVVNPGSVVINGSTFTASSMLAKGLWKVLGKPEEIDTLRSAQLKTLHDYSMATLNKFTSNGLMLQQGKNTDRVNRTTLYLNPKPDKKFIDYVNTPYKGKLTVLGLKVDSNTTIKQVQQAMSKYDFSLSEEYKNAEVRVFDVKTGARLLELSFNFLMPSYKIESVEITVFPNVPVKKHLVEYKEGRLYLNNLLIDTSANKVTQLKKTFGEPNAILEIMYRGSNGYTYNARRYDYREIAGISLIENPFNQSLLAMDMDFLSLRKENDLYNPVIDLVINKKIFKAAEAVPGGPDDIRSFYALDSVSKLVVDAEDKTYVTSSNSYGKLQFEFAGDYNFTKRVYSVTYHLNTVRSKAEIDSEPVTYPELYIQSGSIWLQTNKSKIYWNNTAKATDVFNEIIGSPALTTEKGVSEFPNYGLRMWAKDGKLNSVQFYLDKYINAYSGNNDAPGTFTGKINVEGTNLTTRSTVDQVLQSLSMYKLKKAYENKNHIVYEGSYNGVQLYLTFLLGEKRLISVSVSMVAKTS